MAKDGNLPFDLTGDSTPEPPAPSPKPATGREIGQEAIQRAGCHAPPGWMALALGVLWDVAAQHEELTSGMIFQRIIDAGHAPPEGRAMGAVMLEGKKRGWITPTERFVTSSNPKHHGDPARVWRSNIWQTR